MPKAPTTTHRGSLSPSVADKQLHKLFDYMFGTVKARTDLEPEIIDLPSDRSQSPSTRRKRNMIINLLKLGRKTKSDYSASSTQAKKSFIIDILKMGNSEKTSDDSSFSDSSGSCSGFSSSSSSDAHSTSCHEGNLEGPLPVSMPVLPSGECDAPSVASPPTCEIKAKKENEGTILVHLDGDNNTPTSKKRSSSKRKQSASTDSVSAPAAQSTSTDHLVTPATTTNPSSASAFSSNSNSASDPAPDSASAPASASSSAPASHPADPTSDPSTISFPFNHFPTAPSRPAAPRRGLRREHGFYHKSHYEIAWVPEFGDRAAPPRTIEGVLPPWDPSFAPVRVPGDASTSSPALRSMALASPPGLGVAIESVESLPSATAAMSRADESVIPGAGASPSMNTRGAILKRRREPEDENVQSAVGEERPVRRRRVGLNNAAGT